MESEKKKRLRGLLGQLISIKNDIDLMKSKGFEWETLTTIYDDLRHVIADLERVIDD